MQEWVASKVMPLLEEINKRLPYRLLGCIFGDFLGSLAVADKCLGIVVLLLANVIGIHGGLLEAREGVCAVVVHGGLGGGHVGGRHFYF